jgi:hypothetical protein
VETEAQDIAHALGRFGGGLAPEDRRRLRRRRFVTQTLMVNGSFGTVQPPRLHRCVAKLHLAKAWFSRGEGHWTFERFGSCHTVLDQ